MTCDLASLLTVEDAAERLGMPVRTAQERARVRNLGRVFGGRVRVLTEADVAKLAAPVGRAAQGPDPRATVTEGAYRRAEAGIEAAYERGDE